MSENQEIGDQARGVTQVQAAVASALEALGFERIPNPGVYGGESKFRITHNTLKALRQDRDFTVGGDGKISGFNA